MEPSDRDLLTKTHTIVERLESQLLGGDGREGEIPSIKREMREHADDDAEQFKSLVGTQNYWKGAIALAGVLILTFGGVLFAHILSGK